MPETTDEENKKLRESIKRLRRALELARKVIQANEPTMAERMHVLRVIDTELEREYARIRGGLDERQSKNPIRQG